MPRRRPAHAVAGDRIHVDRLEPAAEAEVGGLVRLDDDVARVVLHRELERLR